MVWLSFKNLRNRHLSKHFSFLASYYLHTNHIYRLEVVSIIIHQFIDVLKRTVGGANYLEEVIFFLWLDPLIHYKNQDSSIHKRTQLKKMKNKKSVKKQVISAANWEQKKIQEGKLRVKAGRRVMQWRPRYFAEDPKLKKEEQMVEKGKHCKKGGGNKWERTTQFENPTELIYFFLYFIFFYFQWNWVGSIDSRFYFVFGLLFRWVSSFLSRHFICLIFD